MDKSILAIIIFILCTISVSGGTMIQYSVDNASWINMTNTSEINKSAYQINLYECQDYFIRGRNNTTNWTYYETTTDCSFESNFFIFYSILLFVVIAFVITYIVTKQQLFSASAGVLLLCLALDISREGFANLTTDLIKNSVIVIFLGFAYMLLVVPNMEWILGDKDDN